MRKHFSKFKNASFLQGKKLFALLLMVCVTVSAMAQVTSIDQLTNGAVIKIYPHGYYGDTNLSLSCSGDGKELTSYEKAGAGSEWTLEYAEKGMYYIKNELGCYWGSQGKSNDKSLDCTTNKENAERISFTWDYTHEGVCFWNEKEELGLNNLNGYNFKYNWWSSPNNYNTDTNTTFDVMLVKQGDGVIHTSNTKLIKDNGMRFLLDLDDKTGKLLPNDYNGDFIVPHYVNYEGEDYEITSAYPDCFKNCTSVDARYVYFKYLSSDFSNAKSLIFGNVGVIEEYAFCNCDKLQSVSFGNTGDIGKYAFLNCENLQTVSFGNAGNIGEYAFCNCYSLQTISFNEIESIAEGAFTNCNKLSSFTFPSTLKKVDDGAFGSEITFKCYVKNPEDLSISDNFKYCVKEFYVLKSSLEDYKNTLPWLNFADKIFPLADITITKIDMPATVTIKTKGETGKIAINATVYPEDAENKTLKWSSSDETIATVDDMGNVTGLKAGNATVTATATDGSGVTATCTVSVEPTKIDNVSFFGIPSRLGVGEYVSDVRSKVVINPEDADYTNITIETSNPDILRYYNTDRLFGKADGYATVTAKVTAFDGTTETTSIDITVGDPTSISQTTSEEFAAMCLDKRLVVTGINSGEEITIENVAGQTIYKGTSHEITLPASGIYLVKAKGKTIKIYAE